MPLIFGSQYNEFLSISQGGKFGPTAGDPHDALAQFILAINRDRPRSGRGRTLGHDGPGRLARLDRPIRDRLCDDDPFWNDLAKVKPDEPEK